MQKMYNTAVFLKPLVLHALETAKFLLQASSSHSLKGFQLEKYVTFPL
jgi:hypothetical protein